LVVRILFENNLDCELEFYYRKIFNEEFVLMVKDNIDKNNLDEIKIEYWEENSSEDSDCSCKKY
jgi:hypothetical protein